MPHPRSRRQGLSPNGNRETNLLCVNLKKRHTFWPSSPTFLHSVWLSHVRLLQRRFHLRVHIALFSVLLPAYYHQYNGAKRRYYVLSYPTHIGAFLTFATKDNGHFDAKRIDMKEISYADANEESLVCLQGGR